MRLPNVQRPLWPSLLSAAILATPLATAQEMPPKTADAPAPSPIAFAPFSDYSFLAPGPFGGFGRPDIVPPLDIGLVCDDLPACAPAGGACSTEADCCVPGQACSAGTCTPPPCETPGTAGRDGCACTADDECEGVRECTPEGPTAGTCQFFYSIVATWSADVDFDLAYRTTSGRRLVPFLGTPQFDLASASGDEFQSCASESTEAFTFSSARGRDDVSAELDGFGPNGGACSANATLRAVAYGVEVAATTCEECRVAAGPSLILDTPQGPLTCGGLEVPLPPPVLDVEAPGADIPGGVFPQPAPAPDTTPGCGRTNEACCPGDVCDYSYLCDTASGTCGVCGFNLESCCAGSLCYEGNECSEDDMCSLPAYVPISFGPYQFYDYPTAAPPPDDTPGCGLFDEPCCPGDVCDAGYDCNTADSSCGFCGFFTEPCCDGDLCYGGTECSDSNTCNFSDFGPSPAAGPAAAPGPYTDEVAFGPVVIAGQPTKPPLPPPGSAPPPA